MAPMKLTISAVACSSMLALAALLVQLAAPPCRATAATALPNLHATASSSDSNCSCPSSTKTRHDNFFIMHMEYHVQVLLGDPSLSKFLSAINANSSASFGTGELFVFNVTEQEDPKSALLGSVHGYTISTSLTLDIVRSVEIETLAFANGCVNGTVQLQALLTGATVMEIAIVGGTGSFRGANGYGIVTSLGASSSNKSLKTFRHELHFIIPRHLF